MSINSMIGNGLSPLYDLSLQGVTNHAMDLPLEEIETPLFDAKKLLGVLQTQINPTNMQMKQAPELTERQLRYLKFRDKMATRSQRSFLNKMEWKDSGAADAIKGLFGPEQAGEGTLASGLGLYGAGIVATALWAANDLLPSLWNMGTGKVSMTDPTGKYSKQAEDIRKENAEQTKELSKERTAMNQSAINGGRSYDAYAASQSGPPLIGTQNNPTYLQSDPEKGQQPVINASKGTKLNKQDNFDLNLGRFYRNTLEGPNYMSLESYNKNIKDAKLLANKLIDKTPKNSNIPIMQYFIQYKDLPNFKNDYLSLFR